MRTALAAVGSRATGMNAARSRLARRAGAVMTIAALSVTVAACGGSSDRSATNAATGGSSAPAASPVKVYTAASLTGPVPGPEYRTIAETAVKWINDNGGAGGHKVELEICDDHANPNQAGACAAKIASSGAVACIACNTLAATEPYYKILGPKKIAMFGGNSAQTPLDLTSPISFPLSLAFLTNAAAGQAAVRDGCRTINLAIIDFPGTPEYIKYYEAAMSLDGGRLAKVVKMPLTPGDFSSQAVQLLSNRPDCLELAGGQPQFAVLLAALKQQGITGDKVKLYSTGPLDDTVCKEFADTVCKGAVVAMQYPAFSSRVWDPYRAAVEKYASGRLSAVQQTREQALGTWAGFMAFKGVLDEARLSSVTPASFLAAAGRSSAVQTDGILAPINFAQEFDVKGYNRVFNRNAILKVYTNGVYQQKGDFIDMTPVLHKLAGS